MGKIEEALDLLNKKQVESLVVVDENDKPTSVIYKSDIFQLIAESEQSDFNSKIKSNKISDVLTKFGWENEGRKNFLPVYPDTTLGSIKSNLEIRKLDYAIVLGSRDEAIGILSRLEILKQAYMGT